MSDFWLLPAESDSGRVRSGLGWGLRTPLTLQLLLGLRVVILGI